MCCCLCIYSNIRAMAAKQSVNMGMHYSRCVLRGGCRDIHLLWIWRWCWRSPRWIGTADMSCRLRCPRSAAAWTGNRTSSPFERSIKSNVFDVKQAEPLRDPPSAVCVWQSARPVLRRRHGPLCIVANVVWGTVAPEAQIATAHQRHTTKPKT